MFSYPIGLPACFNKYVLEISFFILLLKITSIENHTRLCKKYFSMAPINSFFLSKLDDD